MKRNSMLLVASTLLVMASACTLEITPTLSERENNVKTVDITIVANDKPAVDTEVATKTYIDGTAIKWSDSGEKLKVWEVATPTEGALVTSSKTSSDGITTDSGATMSFGVSMDDKTTGYTNFDYYAVYPSSAYHTGSEVTNIALNTTAAQTPSSTNFDPSHDLLIAKKNENGSSQANNLSMQFARVVAIGKMTIKNLGSSEDITKITFSSKVGDVPVALAGRTAFDLNTAKPTSEYGSNVKDYSIILDYDGQGIKANTSEGMVAYFTCYPFAINSENPGSFKVVVETATKTFTKEVSVSSAKGLAFTIGKASVFSVDMDGIAGQDKAVDLCYAYLVPADVISLTASYGNANVTKPHGDKWSMFAVSSGGCIGVRRNDGKNDSPNDSYIKLPDFVEDIKTVVVTLKTPSAGKTITLESSETETSGSIATIETTDATEYTFDLGSSSAVKTAYYRSHDSQSLVEKIEVYSGTDTRTKLSNPTNITSELNTDDPNVTNTIDVSWDAVDNAGSYIVTLMPASGDDVVAVANTNSCSVTALQYDMEYLAVVEAVPADLYLYKNSDAVDASDVVETGADPGSPQYVMVSNLANVTAGEYIIVSDGNYLPNAEATSAGPAKSSVTIIDNKVQGVTADMTWTFIGIASEMTIKSTQSADYLYCNNDNNGLRVGGTTHNWTITAYPAVSGAFTLKNNTRNRYCATYSAGSDWRSYNSYNHANYGDGGRIYLYKYNDPRSEAEISWSAASGTATWTSSGITSTLPSLNNDESLEVSYMSSNKEVATVSSSGVVTIVGGGSTVISAIFYALPESSYETTTVSYTLVVTDDRTTCATPSFSPASGAVEAGTKVAISCGTPGASIYYTVDGSTPTTSSTLYSSAITIDAAKTIKAIAVKENYLNSAVATSAYTISAGGGGGATSTEATVTISGYASSHSWVNATQYTTVTIDSNITATASGGGNTGKYYSSGNDWRFYQNESATLTISASGGKTIKDVTVTYTVSNSGVLKKDATNISSGSKVSVNSSSVAFSVGNTGSATNGQVRVTRIDVTYE